MKICHTSDTHQEFPDIEKCDILCHTGDYSFLPRQSTLNKQIRELEDFNDKLARKAHNANIILFVPGNHDFIFESNPDLAREILTNATVLMDEEIVIDGIKFYGTPSQPPFCGWAFNHDSELRAHKYKNIPDDTWVLLTHCPPYGILDQCPGSVGCPILGSRIDQIGSIRYHMFGHIHESYGKEQNGMTIHVNSSYMDGCYFPCNDPQVVEI